MNAVGHTTWIVPGGRIPLRSTGEEPEFTSRDEIWLLNIRDEKAGVDITFYYEDQEPSRAFKLDVPARRVRCVRVNDLIDPEAVALERNYAAVLEASTPIVVQIARYDTRQAAQAMSWSLALPASGGIGEPGDVDQRGE